MDLNIQLFSPNNAKELSKMIYLVVDQLEKENPTLNYSLVREEDKPEELIKASNLGKMLMNVVIDYMKSNNIKEIWVGSIIRAVPVYEKLGFIRVKKFFNKEINQDEMEMKFSLVK